MTQEKFEQASKLWEEIDRLDLLIKQIEDGTMINPHNSDYGYLVHLLGKDDVLGFMRTRKKKNARKKKNLKSYETRRINAQRLCASKW